MERRLAVSSVEGISSNGTDWKRSGCRESRGIKVYSSTREVTYVAVADLEQLWTSTQADEASAQV